MKMDQKRSYGTNSKTDPNFSLHSVHNWCEVCFRTIPQKYSYPTYKCTLT